MTMTKEKAPRFFKGGRDDIARVLAAEQGFGEWETIVERLKVALYHNADLILEQQKPAPAPEPETIPTDTLGLSSTGDMEKTPDTKKEETPAPTSKAPPAELKPGQYWCTKCKAVHTNRKTSKIGKKHLEFKLATVKIIINGEKVATTVEGMLKSGKGVTTEEPEKIFDET